MKFLLIRENAGEGSTRERLIHVDQIRHIQATGKGGSVIHCEFGDVFALNALGELVTRLESF